MAAIIVVHRVRRVFQGPYKCCLAELKDMAMLPQNNRRSPKERIVFKPFPHQKKKKLRCSDGVCPSPHSKLASITLGTGAPLLFGMGNP
jgi:hypothetical protein